MAETKTKQKGKKKESAVATETGKGEECNDRDCPFHGKLKTRGRIFRGRVIRKFARRITIQIESMVYIPKYERYLTKRSRLHARLPQCMEKDVNIGDYVKIRETRPLSKIVTFAVIEKLNSSESSDSSGIEESEKNSGGKK